MTCRRAPLRFASLITTLALLVAVITPGWARWSVAGDGGDLQEVCSIDGMRWVAADDTGVPAPASAAHCSDCTLHAPIAFVPVPAVHGPVRPALRHALPHAGPAVPRTLYAWATAQPRAPPRFA